MCDCALAAVLSQLVQLAKVRKRAKRESDRGVKIFNICTCLLPLVLMGSAALGFRGSCIKTGAHIHTAMQSQAAGGGFICFVSSFALNLPAALIQLLIPAAPPPGEDPALKGSASAQAPGAATPLLGAGQRGPYRSVGRPPVEATPADLAAMSEQQRLDDALRRRDVASMSSFVTDTHSTPTTVAV